MSTLLIFKEGSLLGLAALVVTSIARSLSLDPVYRLIDLYEREEAENIRKFVEQAQAGAEAVWCDKLARLQHLLDKRKKEHEDKYKDTPLFVLTILYKRLSLSYSLYLRILRCNTDYVHSFVGG